MSLTHIETIELGSSQSSITFSSIPQDYDDLIIKLSARADNASNNNGGFIKFNGSSANFSTVRLFGSGSTVGSDSNTAGSVWFFTGNLATSNTFGNNSAYISNYTASQNKSMSFDNVMENNATQSYLNINAALWSNTSAITSITIEGTSGNLVTGTVASLYGVTSGGSGTVTTS